LALGFLSKLGIPMGLGITQAATVVAIDRSHRGPVFGQPKAADLARARLWARSIQGSAGPRRPICSTRRSSSPAGETGGAPSLRGSGGTTPVLKVLGAKRLRKLGPPRETFPFQSALPNGVRLNRRSQSPSTPAKCSRQVLGGLGGGSRGMTHRARSIGAPWVGALGLHSFPFGVREKLVNQH